MFDKKYIIYLVLAGLCFLAYANSINNGFVSDDVGAILKNPNVAHLSSYWLQPSELLNSLSYRIAKFNVIPYHLFSIVLHFLNTVLVFFFLRLFFKTGPSFLSAALFAVHPIHTEAVTWISGRPYLFTSLFTLAAYLLYCHATKGISHKRIKFTPYLFSLSVFSYYLMANFSFYFIFPFLLILSDITFGHFRKTWKWWLPFLGILILRIVLAKAIILERIYYAADITVGRIIWTNPIINFTLSVFSHLWLLIWPVKLTLYHEPVSFTPIALKVCIISLFFLISSLPFIFKKAKELFFGIGIFVLFLAPTYSPIIVANLVAERYIYFPSVILSIFAAFLYERYVRNSKKIIKIAALSLFMLTITIYTVRTIIRNGDWRNPEKFWQATVAVSYKSPSAYSEAGLMYHQKADVQKAIALLKKAIEVSPNYAKAYNNLGVIYREIGKHEDAMDLYKKAIEINPRYLDAYYNLGNIYRDIGRNEEAIALYKKAIEIDPKYVEAYNNLGMAYMAIGKNEEAISMLRKAIEINPRFQKAYNNLGLAYIAMGEYTQAGLSFKKAIEIDANYAKAYQNLATVYYFEKQYALAIKYYDCAIALGYKTNPNFLKLLQPYRQEKRY